MKKYKLIKEYPGLPKSIKVGTQVISDYNCYVQLSDVTVTRAFPSNSLVKPVLCFDPDSVENNPEFWEEVKEKEWEILKFKSDSNNIFKLNEKGHYKFEDNGGEFTLENMLYTGGSVKNGGIFIHSIKRLSDGEVFTVGDIIYSPNILQSNEATIISFELRGESILVKSNWHVIGIDLRNAKKIEKKAPLFKTEDGVDIYEDEGCFGVCIKEYSGGDVYKMYSLHSNIGWHSKPNEDHWKTFSTKETAEAYIQKNKPKTVYGVNASFTKTVESKFAIEKLEAAFPAGNWKWFNSEKERDLYIEENKPRFSKRDLLSFGKYVGLAMEFTNPLGMFYHWYRYVRKEK